jgi:acetate kinase
LVKNQVRGKEERISAVESDVEIWIVPTNEELIVARQTVAVLMAN